MWMSILLLLGVATANLSGFRRAMTQGSDFCEPLDYPSPALPGCKSCPACLSSSGCTEPCVTCKERFFLSNGACSACRANCVRCTNDNDCQLCDPGKFYFPATGCQGSTATCGEQAPSPFQPVISGKLQLAPAVSLAITAEMSNYYYNVEMNFTGCGAQSQDGPNAAAGEYCKASYIATANYRDPTCTFPITDDGDTITMRGTMMISVNYDVYFLGVALSEPGFLQRPVNWRLRLNKKLTSETNMAITNNDQCEGAIANVVGTKSSSTACHGSGCAIQGTNTYYTCLCDACHTGQYCETDDCAPTITCPTGIKTINLVAGKTLADAKLSLISPAVVPPTGVDNQASGWTDGSLNVTRQIGAAAPTVVTLGSDDLLSMSWASYALNTNYTVTYKFNDNLGNQQQCSFEVRIIDTGAPTITCPNNIVTNENPTWSPASAADNVDAYGDITVSQTTGDASGGVTANTQQTITYRATDKSNNFAECTFSVTYDTTPPTVTCPADYAVDANVGATGTYTHASWAAVHAAVTFSDVLSGLSGNKAYTGDADGQVYAASTIAASKVYQPAGGTNMGIGGRTYTQSDLAGNTATCIVRVRVTDVTPPTVTCPNNQSYNADTGLAIHAVSGWAALFSSADNVIVASSTSLPASTSFAITSRTGDNDAPHRVTYSATDAAGLTTSCTVNILVEDTQNPTITCPAGVSVPMDVGGNTYRLPGSYPWGSVATADNDGLVGAPTNNAPATFNKGANTVTYTATDLSGLTATCTITVTVVDQEDPVLVCPTADVNVNTSAGTNYFVANFLGTSVSDSDNDAINAAARTSNYANGQNLVWTTGTGSIAVTYTTFDLSGRSDTCSFNVFVNDNEKPTIACSNQAFTTDSNSLYANHAAWTFTASDNADTTINQPGKVTYTPSGLQFEPVNGASTATTITASVTDEDGNTGTCTFTATVSQKCGDLYVAGGEQCDQGVGCTGTCTCDAATRYYVKSYNDKNCKYQVPNSDTNNNVVGATVAGGGTITVNGKNLGSVTTYVDSAPSDSLVASYTDISSKISLTKALLGVDFTPTAAHEYLTVKVCPTTNDYTLSAFLFATPGSAGVSTDAQCTSVGATAPARSYDGSCWTFSVCGSGMVAFGLSDQTYNWLQCNAVANPADVTTTSGFTASIAFSAWSFATRVKMLPSGDAAGATLRVDTDYLSSTNIASPFSFPPDTHTIYVKACNATVCGDACQFTQKVIDGVNPTLVGCPATTLSLDMDAGMNYATYTMPMVYGKDETTFLGNANYPGSATYQYLTYDMTINPIKPVAPTGSNSLSAGSSYTAGASTATLKAGASTFTWAVTDGAGNGPVTCSITITVADTEAPVLTCPDISVNTGAGLSTGSVATTTIGFSDNVDIVTSKQASVGTFAVGRHVISYSTTDVAGNAASCTFKLNVNDNQSPTLTCPSTDVVISTNTADAVSSWSVTYNDNDLANTTKTESIAMGTAFAVASKNPITITIRDAGSYPYGTQDGNVVTCTFNVVIQDTLPPTLTCPSSQSINVAGESAAATWATVTISDNDVAPAPTVDTWTHSSGDLFGVATPSTAVTYTGSDYSGLKNNCSFIITTVDTGAPYFSGAAIGGTTPSCPSNKVYQSASYGAAATGPWYALPVAVDWKGVTSLIRTAGPAPNVAIETLGLSANTVTYEASDAAGNKATCSFTVTVQDNQVPLITCPPDSTINSDAGGNSAAHTFTLDATDDYTAYSGLSWTSSNGRPLPNAAKQVSVTLPLGDNVLKYVATDAAGNPSAECTFTVTVQDIIPPTITCPSEVTSSVGGAYTQTAYDMYRRIGGPTDTTVALTWPDATVDDNSGASNVALNYSIAKGTLLARGAHSITAQATDAAGNKATCSFTANVWKPYAAFDAAKAFAAVSRMVIEETATPQQFQAVVQYVTQVEWPFFLTTPTGLDASVTGFTELPNKRNCFRLVRPDNLVLGPFEGAFAATLYCYQYWEFSLVFANCASANKALAMNHGADCKPSDCSYSDSSTTINLNVQAGNLCETDLGTVSASAELFLLNAAGWSSWNGGDKKADPTAAQKSTAFDAATPINALVRAKSDQVLFSKIEIYSAVRETYSDAARTAKTGTVDLINTNGVVNAGSGFATMAAPFVSGTDYAMFSYTEATLGLQQQAYLKLKVTVTVTYNLGQRRRQFLSYEWDMDPIARRREMLATDSMGVEADSPLTLASNPPVGSPKTGNNPTTSTSFFSTPGGIVVAILLALIAVFAVSCLVAYGSYRAGLEDGEAKGKTNGFMSFVQAEKFGGRISTMLGMGGNSHRQPDRVEERGRDSYDRQHDAHPHDNSGRRDDREHETQGHHDSHGQQQQSSGGRGVFRFSQGHDQSHQQVRADPTRDEFRSPRDAPRQEHRDAPREQLSPTKNEFRSPRTQASH
eukprot:g18422.t1